MNIRDLGIDIEQEEDAAGFLRVDLKLDEERCLLNMKQPGLVDSAISALGLNDSMAKVNYTPDGSVPSVKN